MLAIIFWDYYFHIILKQLDCFLYDFYEHYCAFKYQFTNNNNTFKIHRTSRETRPLGLYKNYFKTLKKNFFYKYVYINLILLYRNINQQFLKHLEHTCDY